MTSFGVHLGRIAAVFKELTPEGLNITEFGPLSLRIAWDPADFLDLFQALMKHPKPKISEPLSNPQNLKTLESLETQNNHTLNLEDHQLFDLNSALNPFGLFGGLWFRV